MPKIAIVDKMHEDGINLLKNNPKFECEIIEDLSQKNLISKLPAFDGITLRRGKINAEILEKCKKLKVISRHGVGIDNVDIKFLKKNNIKLLITGTTTSVSPAEHIMFMILNISKGIDFFDKAVRNGEFGSVMHMKHNTFELSNKKILIVGFAAALIFGVMGLNYTALLSIIVGLSVLIPYVGAFLATIPVIVVSLLQFGIGFEFYMIVGLYLLLQALSKSSPYLPLCIIQISLYD